MGKDCVSGGEGVLWMVGREGGWERWEGHSSQRTRMSSTA